MGEEKKPPPIKYEKRGMSTGAKVAVGCGGLILICVAAVCGGLGYLGLWGMGKVEAYAEEFETKGYKRQSGQVVVVEGPVNEPTVYTAQVVQIPGEVNADIAILAQVSEITGEVNGDIDFTGQVLHIKPGAVVKGDIRIGAAQVVKVEGTVEGEITGDYTVMDRNGTQRSGGAAAPEVPQPPIPPEAPLAPETPVAPEAPVAPESL
jgi:hypothetical protein